MDSLARPGGNITGFSLYEFSIIGKSLDMLKKIAPNIVRVALIYNSDNPATAFFVRSFEAFAGPLAVQPIILPVHGLGVMGMSCVWGLLLSRRVASQPSTTGMLGPEIGGAFMTSKGIIVAVAAFMFALTLGMLTAKVAQSDNDRASNPTIRTMALQY